MPYNVRLRPRPIMSMPTPSPTPDSPAGATGMPSHIGKYRVLKRLGEGATAEVFLCHDAFKNRDVAIKRVRPNTSGDAMDGRYSERFFAAEAALVGRLNHPNVVQILDAVSDPVAPYLVMEHVAGSTLRPFCRADQLLSLELVVELGFKCAMALGYVYRQGLIHRDVKPANLLVVLTNGAITDVKISDFGSVLNLASDVTQIYRVGSLAYMSPEQLDGSALDCRADMYSLGAVLYHLVAGRPPFDAQGQAAMMQQIYHVKPGPLGALRSGVSAGLDAVIQRALAKNPAQRYDTWDEFAQALSGSSPTSRCHAGSCRACSTPNVSTCCVRSISSVASAMWSCGKWCTAPNGSVSTSAMRCSARAKKATASTSWRRARSTCSATARRWPRSAPAPRSAKWPTWRPAPT